MPTLNWIGKEAVINHHLEVPFHLLKDVPELACGESGSGNLIVEGDNLVALKALLPYYRKKVKCIYIDPPYNTGDEGWIYNDNVNSPAIRKWIGDVVGKEGETLDRHDRWLCMMYPRLVLLRDMLTSDGSIWVSMDDSEISLLRLLMDDIFGRDRFVACNIWQKRYSRENREAIGDVHEYVLVYAMNPKRFKETRNKIPPTGKQAKVYRNPNNDPKGRWRTIPLTAQAGHATPDQFYTITGPTGKEFKPSKGRCWGIAEATYREMEKKGRIYFGKKGTSQPNLIRYLSEVEGMVPWTWWPHEEVGNTDESSKELLDIFAEEIAFNTTPKPSRLIERVVQIATSPGDLVLDTFGGSGTTAHSVLRVNSLTPALPGRRFILVQMPYETASQQMSGASIAEKVTSERVRRVAIGHKNAKGEDVQGLSGSFRYVKIGEALFDEHGRINEGKVRFADLARHVYFSETGEPLPKERISAKTPLLGAHNGRAVYLLYNGILKDKSVDGGNVLTSATLAYLPVHDGPKVVYAASCRLSKTRLERENITFKQTPYAIRTR